MKKIVLATSKSIAARALICKAVAGLDTEIVGMPDCDDTRELHRALETLATAGAEPCVCDLGSGAASLRFFVAYAASIPGANVKVVCTPQLQKRPLLPLIEALRSLGADITCLEKEGFPPLYIKGCKLAGGKVAVDASISSQFASALLMASPLWDNPYQPDFGGVEPVSAPYLAMTGKIMDIFKEKPEGYRIEADWSAASYFYEYALIHPGVRVEIENMDITHPSLQGDAKCRELFASVGVDSIATENSTILVGDKNRIEALSKAETPLLFDMEDTPDLVPAFAFALCFAGIKFRFVGVNHLRHKESDRIETVMEELRKAGFLLSSGDNLLEWMGERVEIADSPLFDSHGDHRIAMSAAVLGDILPGMKIENAGVVTKSFPTFYQELSKLDISL